MNAWTSNSGWISVPSLGAMTEEPYDPEAKTEQVLEILRDINAKATQKKPR